MKNKAINETIASNIFLIAFETLLTCFIIRPYLLRSLQLLASIILVLFAGATPGLIISINLIGIWRYGMILSYSFLSNLEMEEIKS
jgi:hypothetical protein